MGNTGLLPVGKTTTTCDQGHMCNMEGAPRLSNPPSVGSVGKGKESECDRKCSRFIGDELAQNDVAIRQNMDLLKDGDEIVDRQAHGIAKDRNIYGDEDIYKKFDQLTQSTVVFDCYTFGDKCIYEFGDRLAQDGVAKGRIYMDIYDCGFSLAQKGVIDHIKDLYEAGDRSTQDTVVDDRNICGDKDRLTLNAAVNDHNTFDNVIYGYGDRVAQNIEAKGRTPMDNDIFSDGIIAPKDTFGKYAISGDNDILLWDVNMVQQHFTSPRERRPGDNGNADASIASGVLGNNVSPPPGFNNYENQWNDLNDGDRLAGANATHQNEEFVRVPLASLHRARRPIDTIDDQNRQALSANPHVEFNHVGQGDYEPQVVPAGNDYVQDVIADIQRQNTSIVVDAARVSREMKQAIVGAHEYLDVKSKIPQELIDAMSLHLETTIVWLVEQIDQQDTAVQHHLNVRTNLKNEVEHLTEQNQQLLNQLAMKKQGSSGLSSDQMLQLQLLGINSVDDLISKYRLLQGRLKNQHLSLTRPSSKLSLASTQVSQQVDDVSVPRKKGESTLSSMEKGDKATKNEVKVREEVSPRLHAAKIPEPKEFKGKTRVELERFFRYFEPYAASMSLSDSDKALFVGFYLPTLQPQHDSLMQRKANYEQVKRELLNALGSDSSITTYTLSTALDKIVKPVDKTYRRLLEEVERKVAEAYGADQGQREQELKKILLRLTQEDANTCYNSTILPHTSSDYYRLKELVLGTEDANKLRKQNVVVSKSYERKQDVKSYLTYRSHPPQQRYRSPDISPTKYSDGGKPQRSCVSPGKREQNAQKSFARCYACDKFGHSAKDCALRGEVQLVQAQDNLPYTVGGISLVGTVQQNACNRSEYFGAKPLLEVAFDGVKVTSLLDSGACVSVISKTALKRILQDKTRGGKITREREEKYKGNGLVGADGSKLKVVNCVRIPTAWSTYPPSSAVFFVVDGLQQQVLIGTNVLNGNPTWLNALEHALKAKREPASLPKHSFASVASDDYKSAKTKKCLESINGVGCKGTKVLETSFKAKRGDAGTESCMKKIAGEKLNEIYTLLYRALFCIREINKNDHQYGQQTMLSTQTRDASIGTVLTLDESKSRNFENQNRDASSYGAIHNKNHKENRKFFKRANFVQSSQSSKHSSPVHQNCNRDTEAIRGLQLFQSSRDPQSTRDAQSSHEPQSTRRQKNVRYGRKNQNYWGQ